MTPPPAAFTTRAVHAGRQDLRSLGVHALPIDLSTTYPFDDLPAAADSLYDLAHGAASADEPIYARLHNPTVARCEAAVADLEGASDTIAFGSGMAAITAALLATQQRGGHVVAVRPLYGTTDHLLTSGLLGLEVTWADAPRVAEALRDDTALVLIETPANPTLDLVDMAAVVEQAGDVPVMVDSTFAPPVIQRPLAHGATLSVHSATKFLGGHGDVVAGVVSTSEDEWAAQLRHVRVATGGVLHPMAAYLMHRSLPTLPQRVNRAQATATILADRLLSHAGVSTVRFPGRTHQGNLCARQMDGPGTIIAFDVGDAEAARRVLRQSGRMTPAVSLGSVDTLIQHPASLTHGVVGEEAKATSGITPGLLRLSVGLEDADDLWHDLETALAAATPVATAHAPESTW